MVGYMIEIIGEGAYLIDSFTSTSSIELLDVNGITFPAIGGGLTFYVVSGEGPYEVASVTDALNLTLVKPWSGPTVGTLSYEIYRPVYLIADVSGVNTDGVGGVIRVTGSNDDTATPGLRGRNIGIYALIHDYWHIRGFTVTTTQNAFFSDQCDMICIEDAVGVDNDRSLLYAVDSTRNILRRAISLGAYSAPIFEINQTGPISNSQCLGEDLYAYSGQGAWVHDVGGVTVKNMTMGFANDYALLVPGMQVGNAVFLHDSLIHYCWGTAAVEAAALGEIIENMNNFWQNTADRNANVANTGGVDTIHCHLPALPLLTGRSRNPMLFFSPSQWDATRNAAGQYPANMDLFGVHNEVAQTRRSWGAMHNYAVYRSTTQTYGSFTGSLYMEDAMEQQFVYNVQPEVTYRVTVQVYTESNYTGNNPQMVIRQPGQTDVTATTTGAKGTWEQLSATFTTGADVDWISVAIRSRNTATLPSFGVYWNGLQVTR